MIKVTFRNGNQIIVRTPRAADELRGLKYPALHTYELLASDYSLLEYLHNEVLIPATAGAEPWPAQAAAPLYDLEKMADALMDLQERVEKMECVLSDGPANPPDGRPKP